MRALIEVAEALEGMADSHKVRRNELTTLAERLRALAEPAPWPPVDDAMIVRALMARYGDGDVSDMLRGGGDEETAIIRAALVAALTVEGGPDDFFDRLYSLTFKLFLDPNEDGAEPVALTLGATAGDDAYLHTADGRALAFAPEQGQAITALKVELFGVECWLPSSIASSARAACALAEEGNLAPAHGQYFCDGPQGHFYTDDLANARALCALIDPDGDDWTVTDTRNPTGGR